MRVEIEWDMTDDLARSANEAVVRHLLRGVGWRSALVWWLLSLVALSFLGARDLAWWGFPLVAALAFLCLGLVFALTLLVPFMYRARLDRYLERIAAWPHRRVRLAVTPDVAELTTPTASGVLELADLRTVIPGPPVTVLLFRGGIAVPVPTERIPAEARPMLRLPEAQGGVP